jgi:DNA-binding NarL/FixJ family response regulator/tetratricopeptide (TPR) repeat protein
VQLTVVAAPRLPSGPIRTGCVPVRLLLVGMGATTPFNPFVGRDAELAALKGLVRGVAAGRGRAVWVEGEPGIGKSSLLAAGLSDVDRLGCATGWAVADELSQRFPLRAITDCLRRRAHSQAAVPADVAGVLQATTPAGVLGGADPVAAAVERLLALVDRLCASSPLVMVMDDLQWADDASLVAWHQLALAVEQLPLLLVAASRPVPQREMVLRLRSSLLRRDAALVSLGPLASGEVSDLVAGLVGAPPGPGLRRLAAHASGNPLYLREIVDTLLRERRVTVEKATAELAPPPPDSQPLPDSQPYTDSPPSPDGAPASLASAIARRLGFLSPAALSMLGTAALLGTEFSVTDLALVLGRQPTELIGELQEAQAAGVVTESSSSLAFRHGLIRQALYERMPATLRVALHRHAAHALAEAGAGVEQVAGQLLGVNATLDTWAVRWIAAHASALTNRSPEIAAELLSHAAWHVAEDDPSGLAIHDNLAKAQFRLGRHGEAEACARQVLLRSDDPVVTAEMRWILSRVLFSVGRNDEALSVVHEALRQPDLPMMWRARMRALQAMSLRYVRGDLDAAEIGARDALALGEGAGDSFAVGYALCIRWLVASVRREHGTALQFIDRALDVLSRDANHPDLRAFALDNKIFTLQNLDRLADADAYLSEARRDAERTGDRQATLHIGAAVHYYWVGRWDDAVAELDSVAEDGPEITHFGLRERGPILLYHGVSALVAVQRDNRDAARQHLEAGFAEPIDTVSAWENCDFLVAARALDAERSGDIGRAVALLAPILETRPGQMTLVHQWLPDLVRVAVAADDTSTARAALERCEEEAAREEISARATAALSRCRGLLFFDAEALQAAASHYEEVGRSVEQALTLEDAAAQLAAQGQSAPARAALRQVADIYAGLGAYWCLRRAETRLRAYGVRRRAHGPRRRATTGWQALSRTELTVAYLVGEGRSNPDIAAELFLSRGTVQTHVSHILAKLGVHSRVEIAREVMNHPLAASGR